MKIRKGFISNSSSSSFVCDITGYTDSGYDVRDYDLGFCSCNNEHTFCFSGWTEVEAFLQEHPFSTIPSNLCPICNGTAKPLIVKRINEELKLLNISFKDLMDENSTPE